MRIFVVLAFVASCLLASGQGFVLKDSNSSSSHSRPLATIIETKNGLLSDAQGVIGNLKQSAQLKKQALVSSVTAAAKFKLNFAKHIKDAKVALLKGVAQAKYSKFASVKHAKEAFANTFLETKKAQFSNAIATVAAKTKRLFKHKLPIKETMASIFNGAVSKVQDVIAKKKAHFLSVKAPAASTANLFLLKQQPYKLYTYSSDEAPVIGKILVKEVSWPVVEKPQQGYVYPANTYGPPANTYGPPADTYGPPVDA